MEHDSKEKLMARKHLLSQLAYAEILTPKLVESVTFFYVPDWEPVKWVPSQGSNSMYRNSSMPDSMMESFPPAPGPSFPEPAAMADPNIVNPYSKQGRG
jgi:hypothetical protein